MEAVDTHCHIHFDDYGLDAETVLAEARKYNVTKLIVVGCTPQNSQQGVEFASTRDGVWAAVGIHPHEAKHHVSTDALAGLRELASDSAVVAIGECGLDYYYDHSPKKDQVALFEQQLQIASDRHLPVIFHVRDAFDDFFPIFDNFSHLRGVVHSFTAGSRVLEKVLTRNLHVGLNGIMTFTKDQAQLAMARSVPLASLLLETDAPYLTPEPFRGTICEPRHVVETAKFLAELRNESSDEVMLATTSNAISLFGLHK